MEWFFYFDNYVIIVFDFRVLEVMFFYLIEQYGNVGSVYFYGW